MYMLGRQERLAILLLLVVAILVIVSHLVLNHVGKGPFTAPYSENAEEGDLVSLSGTIENVKMTKDGGNCILTVDNVSVFLPNHVVSGHVITQGTNITVIGIVRIYMGKREIAVESASDVEIPDNR